jgi:hypothetical protein
LSILNDFERRLGGMVEGFFTKAFKGGVHPVELAHHIVREMDTNKTVGIRQVWVPNQFDFRLSPPDRERFAKTEKALRRELEQVVKETAAERGWELVGAPEVVFDTDSSLSEGTYTCLASLVEPPTGAASAVPGAGAPAENAAASLVVVTRGQPERVFPLAKERVIIGRLADSDVVVADPGVSRQHAEVRRENDGYVITDLGSTNGTMVNEAMIGERTLQAGDRITIGRTVLEFRSA